MTPKGGCWKRPARFLAKRDSRRPRSGRSAIGPAANVASVNYYFGDKQRLYLDAVREAQCVRVEQVPMPEWDPDTPADVRLRGFIHTMLSRMIYEQRPAWHRDLMLRELVASDGGLRRGGRGLHSPHGRGADSNSGRHPGGRGSGARAGLAGRIQHRRPVLVLLRASPDRRIADGP